MELEDYTAFTPDGRIWYCLECAVEHNHENREKLQKRVDNHNYKVIHEDTVQYEQYPGEIIPLEGIYCATCGEELYAPYED